MSDGWREAKSLQQLEKEIQQYFPGTTTWEIGDSAHQSRASDHNPNDANVVCAKDILGDGGIDLQDLADHLTGNPHPDLRYVIHDHYIYERSNDYRARSYSGSNPHETHLHVSVGNGPDGQSTSGYDDTSSWKIDRLADGTTTPSNPSTGTSDLGDRMKEIKQGASGRVVRILQGLLCAWGYTVSIDGQFGPKTAAAVKKFQEKYAKPSDGIVGPVTWDALLGL